MKRNLLLYLLLFTVISTNLAQNVLPIGQWRAHHPYRKGIAVTQSNSAVYYATEEAILSIEKEDMAVSFLSKVDGLSNVGIQTIKYNTFSDILVVIYTNSVIDLVKPDEIITMNQIANFDNFVGEKTIADIFIENDSIIYLAANYGISKVNIFANEFVFTTFTGVPVNNVEIFGGFIYGTTEEGIYRADQNNLFLDDFRNWVLLGPEEGFPEDYSSNAITTFDGSLFVNVADTVFQIQNGGIEFVYTESDFSLEYLSGTSNYLMLGYRCNSGSCGRGKVVYFNKDGAFGTVTSDCAGVPLGAIEDQDGRIWFGDDFRDFRMLNSITDGTCNKLSFNSPFSEESWEIVVDNDQVWVAAGGLDPTLSNRFRGDGFWSFINGEWTIYNRSNREELKGDNGDMLDFISVAIHPVNGKIYSGSYFEGLAEITVEEDQIVVYNELNSSLTEATGDPGRIRVSGLSFDDELNLWVSNNSSSSPISVFKADGTWQSFDPPGCSFNEIFDVDVDPNGFKWFIIGTSSAGVMVFDEGDMDDPSDDRCKTFTSTNSDLTTNNTNCLVADLEGDVWVGTTEGVIVFECGGSAFDQACTGSQRFFEQDGFGAFLLETEDVQTIAVDGANRKWVGTRNGVFVLSPTGDEQIQRFTAENSPLLDNTITDIAINQSTGEVFIGTNTGIISYQSDAVGGGNLNSSNIQVFPNPVRPEYEGPIAIKGLARDANVKITDINGRLVFETQALGGQAIWDGRDYNGRKANTGVYLVFSTSNPRNSGFNNADAAVTKILLVN